jgi:hypothetical protein
MAGTLRALATGSPGLRGLPIILATLQARSGALHGGER